MAKMKVNMLEGSLSKNLIYFCMPVILTGILQLLFNACDMIVVGRFSGSESLAAVGATAALTNLLVNAFMGLSVGVNVLAAQFFGARDYDNIQSTVHTAITLGAVCGSILAFVGIVLCKPCLQAMGTPADVIDLSVLYMRIYFLGMPFSLVYNFGAAILRAQGNTRQPLIFLVIAGVVNVVLNLILVIGFHMSVAGVAIATAVSQAVSAAMIIHYLRDPGSVYHLDFRKLRIHGMLFKKILRIGLPASVNSMLFSFSNMQIQSSINLFGSAAMAGCSAAGNIEGFIYIAMNAMHQAAINFTGQNIGAGHPERVPKVLRWCLLYVTIIGLGIGGLVFIFGKSLLSLYTQDLQAIELGAIRNSIVALTYFMCGYMEVFTGVIRGMGYSFGPMVISLLGACAFRIVWIYTIFRAHQSLSVLFLSWPASWIITTLALVICYAIVMRKKLREHRAESLQTESI